MRSMPAILGISTMAGRFNTLGCSISNVDQQTYVIAPDEVCGSGLRKDRIVITYPKDSTRNNDIVLLEAAAEKWLKKCRRRYNNRH